MFIQRQKWDFLNSIYFCFITLSTIGFGDFVPKNKGREEDEVGGARQEGQDQTELVRAGEVWRMTLMSLLGQYWYHCHLHHIWNVSLLHGRPPVSG